MTAVSSFYHCYSEDEPSCKKRQLFSLEEKIITEQIAARKIVGKTDKLVLEKGMVVTPSAKDVLRHAGGELMYCF